MSFTAATHSASSDGGDREAIALLRELVAIETPSFDAAASTRIAELLEARFREVGASVVLHRTEAGTDLVADVPGHGAPLLLVGHTDTVWPVGTIETSVPWIEEGDRIRGPGVFDMKSGIVVMLHALAALRARPHRAVRVVLVSDEEVGSPLSQPLLREVCEGVAAAIGFESPHPDGALKVGRRGSSRVRIAVEGRSAHAGLDPELGVSAIDELVDQLLLLRDLTATGPSESPVLCNVGTLEGGGRTNVVPDRAAAEVGLRFADADAEDRVLAGLRGLAPRRAGAKIAVDLLSHRPTWRAGRRDHELLASVARLAAGIGQALGGRPANGAGDTNLLGSLGIPTLDGFGPRGAGAHATSEHILTPSLFKRIELLTTVLSEHAPGP
ncbi:M20 family metallopeptidase [Microbacterium esteraromaticum]|uniref:M20 family metallopeptidase n=1 Tax=Microbacterium esteraromaticum TaxID=57043 RepID=A0A7D8ALT8_9MICO|nr:M20/M25/M40 family metallo-hydrolase [Microbacterium esteraromaticum]QMU97687.1 M20 family metallopeptidase [Microbacterium esteraromaticum]